MAEDPRIHQLLEEILDSGLAPEHVCRDAPELLPAVKNALRRLGAVDAEIAAIFPVHELPPSHIPVENEPLPAIPGYDLLSVLGRGGMGIVYKARHLKLRRTVAIKMLLAGAYAAPPELARFTREAQAIAALQHPHVVQLHDIGEFDGRPFFTMEYMGGGSLAQKLAGVPQPTRDAAATVVTLAEAVQFAHASGIVHRDLKPANILLASDGTPKVSDFGLARSYTEGTDLTLGGSRLGTPSYMSPEQALGREGTIGPSTDIYSLGAILYEMLTGRPPFRGETPAETERQLLAQDPVPPSRLNARVPRDLETICLKCLHKEPSRRYATATDLAADLNRFLHGEPIAARRATRLERLAKWTRRNPARGAAWLGGIAALVAILGSILWTASQRAAIESSVSEDLAAAVRFETESDWRAARNILERAKTRLEAGTHASALMERAASIERELELVDRLSAMRFERAGSREVEFDKDTWWNKYREVFLKAGLYQEGDTPAGFASRVSQSSVRTALIDAMDDWSICTPDSEHLQWMLNATKLADPGSAWRDKARDFALWKTPDTLAQLAREVDVEKEPVTLMLIVAGRLLDSKPDESLRLLRRIQAVHPGDFWANFALGETLHDAHDPDAIGYFRAAIAIRPEASAAHFILGEALAFHKHIDESIESLQRAIALDPGNWKSHHNLALSMGRAARYEEAREQAAIAISLNPKESMTHEILGHSYKNLGRYPEAIESYKRAIDLAPAGSERRAKAESALAKCQAEAAAAPPPHP